MNAGHSRFRGSVVVAVALALLSGTAAVASARRADLTPTNVASSSSLVVAGGPIKTSAKVKNIGNASAPGTTTAFYLSKDRNFNNADVRLGKKSTLSVPA